MGFYFRLLFLGVLTLALLSCKGKKPEAPKGRPPAPVSVAAAVTGSLPVYLEAVGNVESFSSVSIKSMVNGEITRVHFREGQDVARGEILFSIDPRPFEMAIRKGEADLGRIRAQLATARANADRYGKLVKDGIVTAEQYDLYRTLAESLEADLAAQKASIESQRVQLSYCSIRSPISGRSGNLLITAGNVVKANDTLSLVTINQITPIAVAFNIPEPELLRTRAALAKGALSVQALPSGDSGRPEQGKVTFIDNAVDSATGTIKLKASFPNSTRRLWPGQFSLVRLLFPPLRDVVTVPSQAVQTGQKGEFLYVVKEDMTVELRPVTTGARSDGVVVILEGLKSAEQVVIDGQLRLGPGAKIEVRKPVQPGSGLKNNSSARVRAGA